MQFWTLSKHIQFLIALKVQCEQCLMFSSLPRLSFENSRDAVEKLHSLLMLWAKILHIYVSWLLGKASSEDIISIISSFEYYM